MLTNHAIDKMPSANRKSEHSGDMNGTSGTTPEESHRSGFDGCDGIDGADGVTDENGWQKGHGSEERKRQRIVVVGLGMVSLSFM